MPPLVTIALPFYNAENTLFRAISSIQNQTYSHLEVFLINNQSSDSSRDIAGKFARLDQRIHLIDEKKQGVAHAINAAIARGSGKYLARMDADDYSHPARIHEQVHYLEKNEHIGAVGSLVNHVCTNSIGNGFAHYVKWSNQLVTQDEIFFNRFVEFPLVNPSIMFRRELFTQFGPYRDGPFPEDYELFLRFISNGVFFEKIAEYLLDWYDSTDRLTRSDGRYSPDAFFTAKFPYLVEWLSCKNPFHPNIWVWGAGKIAKKRSLSLEQAGLHIGGFIDVDIKKDALHYIHLPSPGKFFIVSLVSNRGARQKIAQFLIDRGYIPGTDFILAG